MENPQSRNHIKLEDGSHGEIISGKEVKLSDDEKIKLIQTYLTEESRNGLSGVLEKPTISEEKIASRKDFDMDYLNEIVDSGLAYVIKIDGKVAGMMGIANMGKMPDGRDIFMPSRLIIYPEFRGKKLSHHLMPYALQEFVQSHPENPILVITRNNHIKALMSFADEIGEVGALRLTDPEFPIDEPGNKQMFEKRSQEEGWTAFLFDPKNLN